MKYHILFDGNVVASFKYPQHRDLVLEQFKARFVYAEDQFTVKDDK